jgi:beta-phosphoglucomutase-like phosphatase (HAD superfamily)
MIRAIVFDMDGVLIDAKDWHFDALNRALGLFGYGISRYDHITSYDGLPTRRKLEMLSKVTDLPTGLHAFINEMKQCYTMEEVHAKCRPVFSHEYALSRLKADGYLVAVASNSIRSTIDTMMERAMLKGYLDAVLSNEDVREAKPSPEIYRLAMERLGVAPHETLVVEDNENGIRAARGSGAHVMEVTGVEGVTLQRIRDSIARAEVQDVAVKVSIRGPLS